MSEFRKVTGDSEGRNKELGRMTDEKTGRRWVRCALWGIVMIAVGFLIAGTIAALLWCN